MSEPLRLLIDTDPGVDDGVALMLALTTPGVHVDAITVVSGNAGLAQTVTNARFVAETCGSAVPVYAGARAPLVRPPIQRPTWLHGVDGFAGLDPRPRRGDPDPGFAPDRIVELVMAAPGAITIVTLGPLTNLALALAREPGIAAATRELIVMGGAARTADSLSPAAEFNFAADPEAARAVFAAGFPALTMVGIDLAGGASRFSEPEIAAIAARDTPPARLAAALLHHLLATADRRPHPPGDAGAACADAVAMAVALDRLVLAESVDAFVDIETHGELTSGMAVVDRLGVLGRQPNAHVGLRVDAPRFKHLFDRL